MCLFSFLRSLDQYPLNFLKGKNFKSLPGAIFSLFITLFTLSLLVLCLVYYFIQSSQISFNYENVNSFRPEPVFPQDSMNISIKAYNSSSKESLEKVYSYYRFSILNTEGTQFKLKILPTKIEESSLNITIQDNLLDINEKDINFPRIMLQSCKVINSLKKMKYVIYDNEDDKYLEGCKEDIENFYSDPLIKDKLFIYYFGIVESYLSDDYEMKVENRQIGNPFIFGKKKHIVFSTSKKKIAVLYDNALFKTNEKYQFYTSWSYPSKTDLKSFTQDFDLQQIFSVKNNNEIMTYKITKTPFMKILPWLGSMNRFISCLSAVPGIWCSYYLSILIFKLYKKKNPNDHTIENSLGFDIEKITYCKWLGIKFGCSSKSKKINQEMNRMRKHLSEHFENLYNKKRPSSTGKEVEFDVINQIDINSQSNEQI